MTTPTHKHGLQAEQTLDETVLAHRHQQNKIAGKKLYSKVLTISPFHLL
jgi:hypothetical protein